MKAADDHLHAVIVRVSIDLKASVDIRGDVHKRDRNDSRIEYRLYDVYFRAFHDVSFRKLSGVFQPSQDASSEVLEKRAQNRRHDDCRQRRYQKDGGVEKGDLCRNKHIVHGVFIGLELIFFKVLGRNSYIFDDLRDDAFRGV